ncbi:4-hydroxyacetophenone monooxygenase [Flexivirga endophytica]|uniref:4-hydroxyacetophenone monooxygenase n=1 Tax=Flexivirga endophytica TaxID=1849103 RepID=A0A916T3V0_9MICO|nr:NAD(P)/FAD-dependent oxidoreductase [Flexivirga endophytica]GGB29408.1 4-hydroxyacetophenone monooxygenase [Flexivirga endophytica]GHB50495.1 4-hydroxyacetophenone monooxygenase [Flexivirga endophytica]
MGTRMNARVDHDLVIVGSGFSGIGMAIAAKNRRRDFVVLEKADEIGGTWRDNRYPGCECDVPSHLYSFSFELNPYWSKAYATADEIQDYLLYCVEKFDLRQHMRFGSVVERMTYDEGLAAWHLTVTTGNGETHQLVAGAVALGVGALHEPVIPEIPGIESFRGELLHTAAWDPGTTVVGKRVGVIGTGCSGVQVIPPLAEDAHSLTVFQRTPTWVLPKVDPAYPDWLIDQYEKRPWLMKAHRAKLRAAGEVRVGGFTKQPAALKAASKAALAHLRSSIKDPKLRAKLTPDYTMGCKRVTMSNTYYPALASDHVTVETSPIQDADVTSLATEDGTTHELDVLVFATGFDVTGSYRHLNITGLGGRTLDTDWAEDIQTYYGVTAPGYPNLFFLLGPNTVLGHTSVVLMIEAQIGLISRLLDERDERGATAVQVRPQVVPAHMQRLDERSASSVWQAGGCSSWYLDDEGRNRVLWPGGVGEYERKLARPELVDYEFTGSAS